MHGSKWNGGRSLLSAKPAKLLRSRLPLLLLPLAFGGCSLGLMGGSAIPLPVTTKVIDDLPRVSNSPVAPCWQQRQVAAQNSYLATVRVGVETVYAAPCDVDKPTPGAMAQAKS
jgi:hypothetical protein